MSYIKTLPPKCSLENNFSTNVNPLGPPGWVPAFINSNVNELSSYPELWHQTCDKKLAEIFKTSTDNHLTIPGTSSFISLLPYILKIKRNKNWITMAPSFWEYKLVIELNKLKSKQFDLPLGITDENIVIQNFMNFIKQNDPGVIFICTPNNPTGHIFSPSVILDIADEFKDTYIIVDLTYAFFLSNFDSYVNELLHSNKKNIICILSYSKFYCLPGIRLGSVFFNHEELADRVRKMHGPVRINKFTEMLIPLLLQDTNYMGLTKNHFESEWIFLLSEIKKLFGDMFDPISSQGCFRFFEISKKLNLDGNTIQKRLFLEKNIRICSGGDYGLDNTFRIRAGLRDSNINLISALASIIDNANQN